MNQSTYRYDPRVGVMDWFNLVAFSIVGFGTLPIAWRLWQISKTYPDMRSGAIVWSIMVGLSATVPVWLLVTRGAAGWYPGAVGATVLLVAIVYGVLRRRVIWNALRVPKGDGRPDGPPVTRAL